MFVLVKKEALFT